MFMRYQPALGLLIFRVMSSSADAPRDRVNELKRQLRSLGDRVNRHELSPADAKLEFMRLETELNAIEQKSKVEKRP